MLEQAHILSNSSFIELQSFGFLKNTNLGIQISSSLDFRVACSNTFSNHFHFTLSNFWLLFYNSLWFAPFQFDMFMLHTTHIKSHFTWNAILLWNLVKQLTWYSTNIMHFFSTRILGLGRFCQNNINNLSKKTCKRIIENDCMYVSTVIALETGFFIFDKIWTPLIH